MTGKGNTHSFVRVQEVADYGDEGQEGINPMPALKVDLGFIA